MTDAIGKAPTRPLTAPLRGTAQLSAPQTPAASTAIQQAARDVRMAAASAGASALAAFAQPADSPEAWRDALNRQIQVLNPSDKQVAVSIMKMVDNGMDPKEAFALLRDKLNWKSFMDAQRSAQKYKEEQAILAAADATWRLFYESLERYLTNLQSMAKVEGSVSERKLNDARSETKFTDRLLTAAATLLPELRVSLLSAKLSQKA